MRSSKDRNGLVASFQLLHVLFSYILDNINKPVFFPKPKQLKNTPDQRHTRYFSLTDTQKVISSQPGVYACACIRVRPQWGWLLGEQESPREWGCMCLYRMGVSLHQQLQRSCGLRCLYVQMPATSETSIQGPPTMHTGHLWPIAGRIHTYTYPYIYIYISLHLHIFPLVDLHLVQPESEVWWRFSCYFLFLWVLFVTLLYTYKHRYVGYMQSMLHMHVFLLGIQAWSCYLLASQSCGGLASLGLQNPAQFL